MLIPVLPAGGTVPDGTLVKTRSLALTVQFLITFAVTRKVKGPFTVVPPQFAGAVVPVCSLIVISVSPAP